MKDWLFAFPAAGGLLNLIDALTNLAAAMINRRRVARFASGYPRRRVP